MKRIAPWLLCFALVILCIIQYRRAEMWRARADRAFMAATFYPPNESGNIVIGESHMTDTITGTDSVPIGTADPNAKYECPSGDPNDYIGYRSSIPTEIIDKCTGQLRPVRPGDMVNGVYIGQRSDIPISKSD